MQSVKTTMPITGYKIMKDVTKSHFNQMVWNKRLNAPQNLPESRQTNLENK